MNSIIGILVNGENKTNKKQQISENYIFKVLVLYLTVRKDVHKFYYFFICRTLKRGECGENWCTKTRPIFPHFPKF